MSEPEPVSRDAAGRSRILAAGVVTTAVNRGIAALVPLLAIPIALDQLGRVGYGAWATAVSLTSLVAFADLGIGTGLMTRLGRESETRSTGDARRVLVSSAYAMVGCIAVALLAAVLLSAPAVDWSGVLGGVPGDRKTETIFLVTVSAFVLNIVASLVVRVQYGIGQQARSNLWQAAGSCSMLLGVWLAATLFDSYGPFILAAAYVPVLVALLNSVVFFTTTGVGRRLAPSPRAVEWVTARGLLVLGSRFLAISVLMTVSLALDPLIVARTANLDEVADFAIPSRIFGLIGAVAVMMALPLWPLNAGAIASGDVAWIRRTTVRMSVAMTTLVAVASIAVILVAPTIVDVWLGGHVDVDLVLWSGLGVSWMVQTVVGPAFMVQNGAEIVWPQLVGYTLLLAVVPLKVLVSSTSGYAWLPWVGAGLYSLLIWPACFVGYRKALQRASRRLSVTSHD